MAEAVDPAAVGPLLLAAVRAGAGHDLMPFSGQVVELVRDILPAAQIVERIAVQTRQALARASSIAGA
jgi:hypothetical protein